MAALYYLEHYEKQLSFYIKEYNQCILINDIRNASGIFQYNIRPTLSKYKQALWSKQFLNDQGILYYNSDSLPIAIYLSMDRAVLIQFKKFH